VPDGEVLVPLDEDEVRERVRQLNAAGVEAGAARSDGVGCGVSIEPAGPILDEAATARLRAARAAQPVDGRAHDHEREGDTP